LPFTTASFSSISVLSSMGSRRGSSGASCR
jgi:hypothetical protein